VSVSDTDTSWTPDMRTITSVGIKIFMPWLCTTHASN